MRLGISQLSCRFDHDSRFEELHYAVHQKEKHRQSTHDAASPKELFRDHWIAFHWTLSWKRLRGHQPACLPSRSPVTLPAGSPNMARLGPPGTSVGGSIVLPPSFSTRSSAFCSSLTC